jgi:hypothetical protein
VLPPNALRRKGGKVPDESTPPESFKPSRKTVEAYRRGDLDAHMSSYAPDAVLDMSPRGLGIVEGRAAIRGFWEDYYLIPISNGGTEMTIPTRR